MDKGFVVRRFYKLVGVEADEDGGYRVTLDGRELRSPAKRSLRLPTPALAEAVAAEWEAQTERVEIGSMPLTALVSTAADRTGPMRDQIVGEIARYGETDLLCYRAEGPDALVQRLEREWQPLLDWLSTQHDAHLRVHVGVLPQQQPREALAALRLAVEGMDDFALAALSSATAATGSVVIGLALVAGRIGPDEAAAAAQLDELFQAETWGEDPEAGRRRAALTADIHAADRFLRLLRA